MQKEPRSWYNRWFGSQNLIKRLVTVLLVLLIILLMWQVRFILTPIFAIFSAVGAPIIIAGVLYYLLHPLVKFLVEKIRLPRRLSIGLVMVVLLVIIVSILAVVFHVMRDQTVAFIHNWPTYWTRTQNFINTTLTNSDYHNVRSFLNQTNSNLNDTVLDWGKKYISTGLAGITNIASQITSIGVILVSTPFILYYMLLDGHKFSGFIADKLPTQLGGSVKNLLTEISQQIARYIRGQLGVGLAVIIMFSIGYTIIGMPYGILLAIMAGLFNMIPYVGSILAQVPVFAVALVTGGPKLLLLAVVVLVFEQPIEAHVIAPKILGDALSIHPVTVIVVLLTGGHVFGVLGIILAVPTYAVLKVIVTHLYRWWRQNSVLFDDIPEVGTEEEHD
ncbi:AI-2E family transporter [Leuconostocaceae bacterium ESL0723]|nr:AI-2E family transporter [Leuconostocaceae bacterium ESL0723]